MKIKRLLLSACVIFSAITSGCTKSNCSLQDTYGPDTDYFIGLSAAEKGETKKAIRYFDNCIAHGSKYTARRSMEHKIKLVGLKRKISAIQEYLNSYDDDYALCFAGKELISNKEYAVFLDYTKNIDISKCSNELVKLYLACLKEKNDPSLDSIIFNWFICRPISEEHVSYFNEFLKSLSLSDENQIQPLKQNTPDLSQEQIIQNAYNIVITYRIKVFQNNFSAARELMPSVLEFIDSNFISLSSPLIEDFGKTYLSENKELKIHAEFLEKISRQNDLDNSSKYSACLYAGKIYSKISGYSNKSIQCYKNALEYAPDNLKYDRALWYLLNASLNISTESTVESVKKYCLKWHNPYYFDDLLDSLSTQLITEGRWATFKSMYPILEGHADNATTSQYAYLTGRLIETGYIKGTKQEARQAYEKAAGLNAGIDVYYRLLAAHQLGWNPQQIETTIFLPAHTIRPSANRDAQILLCGYADFGFADYIYPEWKYFHTVQNNIFDIETIQKTSEFLRQCATAYNNYYYYSLRMMATTVNIDDTFINRKCFELSYPQNFLRYIQKSCNEFNVDEYDILGLIRTESFFQPEVQSFVGAVGLTQLMESTAQDCAKALKIQNLNLKEPSTNIRIGTYYYANLVKRLNSSNILALFAYNAGPNRVKRWLKTSQIGLGKYNELPSDLFLETIPYRETREYGRKVISASAIYAWLYYQRNPGEIVVEKM